MGSLTLRRWIAVVAVAGLAGVPLACAEDTAAGLSVSDAWARATPGSAPTGAVYLTIESGDGDRLLGATVPTAVAASASIHRTLDEDGMVSMESVDVLEIPAGEAVELAPGGAHIMLVDLAAPLAEGTRFELALDFDSKPDEVVSVTVRDTAPDES